MKIDGADIPWGHGQDGGTYHGFSDAAPAASPTERPKRVWHAPRTITIAGGILGAVALGLALGILARPNLGLSTTRAPMRAVSPAAGVMAVEVTAPIPPPAVKSAGKLEVLPPDLARRAERGVEGSAGLPRWPDIAAPAPMPQTAASDPACGGGRSAAAQMVCADPELAAADRELNRAYRRALRSGVSPEQLRDEQRDWLSIREDAARRSPRAVAEIYDQRIDELNQIADDGPG